MKKTDFGSDFRWGTATAAYQIEGAYQAEGKGLSIWDTFTNKPGTIIHNQNGNIACDHYRLFSEDLELIHQMGIPNYRFSIPWSRIFPQGTGQKNQKGIDHYHRLIDHCLELNIEPWVTTYHWDLPQALEDKGGWTNRDIIGWFEEYVSTLAKTYGDKVKNWMVLNEPMVFTGAGYFLGVHAPGKKGLKNFLPAMHHAVMCQALGGKILRHLLDESYIGTTFSCSYITPLHHTPRHERAANRVDALLNRLFLEPALGLGYPKELSPIQRVENYMAVQDEGNMTFDFDFIGIQNYTREVVRHKWTMPLLWAALVEAPKRNVEQMTTMKWEVYPEGIYHLLKKYWKYPGVKEIIVTENGAAFPDLLENGQVDDPLRKAYLQNYLNQILRAKQDGVNVSGYFVWTFLDNFEWAEGYDQRFGLVYTDYESQQRIIKNSGHWYANFIAEEAPVEKNLH